jgi:hypothetical protein
MPKEKLGTEAIVRDLVEEHDPPPCVVRHPRPPAASASARRL